MCNCQCVFVSRDVACVNECVDVLCVTAIDVLMCVDELMWWSRAKTKLTSCLKFWKSAVVALAVWLLLLLHATWAVLMREMVSAMWVQRSLVSIDPAALNPSARSLNYFDRLGNRHWSNLMKEKLRIQRSSPVSCWVQCMVFEKICQLSNKTPLGTLKLRANSGKAKNDAKKN